MANLQGFNANEHEDQHNFEPIPAGEYLAAIVASELKPTKAGTGSYLELQFQVLDGPHVNRNLWARLNIDNPNPKAVQIANAQLAAICRAVGVLTPKDSAELHNIALKIKVKTRLREDTGEVQNEISDYKPKAATATPAQARPAAQAAVPAPKGSKAPWAK